MTNLLFIRKKFIQLSGRYDLVSGPIVDPMNIDNPSNDYADRGANFFIQAGQRLLDRELPFHRSQAELSFSLATSVYTVNLDGNVRAVKNVFIEDPTDNETKDLVKATVKQLRWKYGGDVSDLASTGVGEPIHYALGLLRTAVAPTSTTAASTEVKRLLVFQPPTDRQYILKVECELEGNLVADTDVTTHSHQFPELLLWASMYQLELSQRNMTGANEWLANVERMTSKLDDDVVEEESSDIEPLPNAWDYIEDQQPSSQILVS